MAPGARSLAVGGEGMAIELGIVTTAAEDDGDDDDDDEEATGSPRSIPRPVADVVAVVGGVGRVRDDDDEEEEEDDDEAAG